LIALLQRVAGAQVDVRGERIAAIGRGLLVFYCAERGDDAGDCDRLLGRVLRLRCFPDEAGRMNRSVADVDGGLLVVPQFTLAADTTSGNRPGFSGAAAPDEGERLFERFMERARDAHGRVQCGRFGADMQVSLVNDGPVTLWLRAGPRRTEGRG
jgi:D-tyrosyl-tRNA(Tyr) deacylase